MLRQGDSILSPLATTLPKSGKKTSLQMFLDDGDIMHLEIRKPRESLPEEIVRTRARE